MQSLAVDLVRDRIILTHFGGSVIVLNRELQVTQAHAIAQEASVAINRNGDLLLVSLAAAGVTVLDDHLNHTRTFSTAHVPSAQLLAVSSSGEIFVQTPDSSLHVCPCLPISQV